MFHLPAVIHCHCPLQMKRAAFFWLLAPFCCLVGNVHTLTKRGSLLDWILTLPLLLAFCLAFGRNVFVRAFLSVVGVFVGLQQAFFTWTFVSSWAAEWLHALVTGSCTFVALGCFLFGGREQLQEKDASPLCLRKKLVLLASGLWLHSVTFLISSQQSLQSIVPMLLALFVFCCAIVKASVAGSSTTKRFFVLACTAALLLHAAAIFLMYIKTSERKVPDYMLESELMWLGTLEKRLLIGVFGIVWCVAVTVYVCLEDRRYFAKVPFFYRIFAANSSNSHLLSSVSV